MMHPKQNRIRILVTTLLVGGALALPLLAAAQSSVGIPALNATPAPGGGTNYTLPLQTMLLMTALSFIPAAQPCCRWCTC